MIWWSKHRHWWRRTSELQKIMGEGDTSRTEPPIGGFYIEQCRCGAVRTIEFKPGAAPIVRMALEGK